MKHNQATRTSGSSQPNFPELEEEILSFWKKNKIFEKSLEKNIKNKKWTFLDGPPFITGLPHYGTLLSSIPKDVFPRYWTMKGYHVRRVWGWDCHGLPAENKVENELNITRKKDIEEKVGIKKFIDSCKKYVNDVSGEWEWYIDHIARWVDFKNAYRTMDKNYMESVMWVFKQMYEKGYIYKGLRVSLYCPHCATPISNFEVAMDEDNYRLHKDDSATYKYKLIDEEDTYILAWSTTPWNKLVTPALAVNPNLKYVKVEQGGEFLILAEETLKMLHDEPKYKIVSKIKGKDLIGKKFEPHYDFYDIEEGKKAFEIIGGDFVTAEEGTGVVTLAAYGEEDLVVMKKENVTIPIHLDEEGHLLKSVPKWGGMYYLKVNKLINEDLKSRGLLYDDTPLTHRVPTCWRCHTRLYYSPQDAWYVDIQKLKPKLYRTNELVNWFPSYFKHGRFQKSIESAPDWCISRSRYWGSPVPVWECDCGNRYVPSSIDELEKVSGQKINDLHKPDIDEVTVPCDKCGKRAKRVPEVLDSWIEAGSASYAERHFPFDKSYKIEDFLPPDFIVEYTGQIRAWFYVLHVIATALYDINAFKNVMVTGVILGTDGRKMSKNYGNYPDPKELISKYGGDALRLYLLSTPVMKGEDIRISEEAYRNQVREMLIPLWNISTYYFSNLKQNYLIGENEFILSEGDDVLDRWIISRVQSTLKTITELYEEYNSIEIIRKCWLLIEDLSKWYIRRIREDMLEESDKKVRRLEVLFYVLNTLYLMLAPLIPFLADFLYKKLTNKESVHLERWPEIKIDFINQELELEMSKVRHIVELGHSVRKAQGIRVRMPMREIVIDLKDSDIEDFEGLRDEFGEIILSELNIKNIVVGKWRYPKDKIEVSDEELQEEGLARDIIRSIQQERKKLGLKKEDRINVEIDKIPEKYISYVRGKVQADKIIIGKRLRISKI